MFSLPRPTGTSVRNLHERLSRGAKISAALKGRPSSLRGRTYEEIHGNEKAALLRAGKTWSQTARDAVTPAIRKMSGPKISAALKGREKTEAHRLALSKAHKGKNYMTVEQRKAAAAKHNSLDLSDCCCYVHGAARPYMISSYTWKLADTLTAAGFDIVIAEAQFGRKRVDCLLAEEWVAFEADGNYHFTPERREYDAQRDEDLTQRFDLPVARLSGTEVEQLYKELVEGGD